MKKNRYMPMLRGPNCLVILTSIRPEFQSLLSDYSFVLMLSIEKKFEAEVKKSFKFFTMLIKITLNYSSILFNFIILISLKIEI